MNGYGPYLQHVMLNSIRQVMKTFYKILFWTISVVLILIAIGLLTDNKYVSFILILISGLIIIPPIQRILKDFGVKGKVIFSLIVTFFIMGLIFINPVKNDIQESNENNLSNIESSYIKTFCEKGKVSYNVNGIKIEPKTEYTIEKAENLANIKFSYDIRLSNNKLSETDLMHLANELKSKLDSDYERIFICYYLPDNKIGAGAWATTHFNPNLEVNILGITPSDIENLKKSSVKNSENTIGKWITKGFGAAFYLVLYEEHGKTFLAMRDDTGSIDEEMIVQSKHGQKRYIEKDNVQSGEYYIINGEGDLEVYDSHGFIEKYIKAE